VFSGRDFPQPNAPPSTGNVWRDLEAMRQHVEEVKRWVSDIFLQLNQPGSVKLSQATIEDTTIGVNNPSSGKFTTVTATGTATAEEIVVQSASAGADLAGKWQASGSATTSGQSLFGVSGYGWTGSALGVGGVISFRSTEAWSGSAMGSRIQFRAVAPATTTLTEYGSIDSLGWRTEVSYLLKDGVTAPSTLAGYASIYVDTADGDLKIKFGDGTVKTIVVDT
jgi:hypothetical protein